MEKDYAKVKAIADRIGFENLTPDEQLILKKGEPEEEKMINSDDYNDAQIENIKYKQKKGDPVSRDETAAVLGKEVDKKNKLIKYIVHGQNDVFHKDYDFKEDDVKFTVEIKMPNLREDGIIAARVQEYLGGTANYWDDSVRNIFYTVALLQTCGKKVPDLLSDPDKINPLMYPWLMAILEDFNEWMGQFRY